MGRKFPNHLFSSVDDLKSLYGIGVIIPNCEPLWLSFLDNGRICSPVNLQGFGNSPNDQSEKYLYTVSVKTQFAGPELHKKLIHLINYLNEKYLSDFELSDEAQYWETGDEKLLNKQFEKYNHILNTVAQALEQQPKFANESYAEYFNRLLKDFRKKEE